MLLTAGIVGMFVLPGPWNVIGLSAAIVVEIAEVYGWIWFLRRYRVSTGAEGMVGERAVVIESDGEQGTVKIKGEIWKARFASAQAPGEETRVTGVDGLTLTVE